MLISKIHPFTVPFPGDIMVSAVNFWNFRGICLAPKLHVYIALGKAFKYYTMIINYSKRYAHVV